MTHAPSRVRITTARPGGADLCNTAPGGEPIDVVICGGSSPQYTLFSGIAPLTQPRGSGTSPAYRGMTWMWRCVTVWPAASPTFTPML